MTVRFVYDDGGRAETGFVGDAEDCVTRAFAITTGTPYRVAYDMMATGMASLKRRGKHPLPRSARNGVLPQVYKPLFAAAGFTWQPLKLLGRSEVVHLEQSELPAEGKHILRLSGHLAAWVDGELRDTACDDRGGTRMVYGMWTLP